MVVFRSFEEHKIQSDDNKHYFRVILKDVTFTTGSTPLLRPSDKSKSSHLSPNLHKLMCIDINWNSSIS